MEALCSALRYNNAGTRSLQLSKDGKALKQLTRSMNMMQASMIKLTERGFVPRPASDILSDEANDAALFSCRREHITHPSFSLRELRNMKKLSKNYVCAESIGLTEYGVFQMLNVWQDAHISSAMVTFNVALLYHQQGLVTTDGDSSKSWLTKAMKMYKMSNALIYNSGLASVEIRRIAWRIKLSTINNLSLILMQDGNLEASRRGYELLERIVNVSQREVSRRVLGGKAHHALLQNAQQHSRQARMVVAPAA